MKSPNLRTNRPPHKTFRRTDSTISVLKPETHDGMVDQLEVKRRGAVVFDLDGTLLNAGEIFGSDRALVSDELVHLLRSGHRVAILSTTPRNQVFARMVQPLFKNLRRKSSFRVVSRIIVYCDGTARKISFTRHGKSVEDLDFGRKNIMTAAEVRSLLDCVKKTLEEMPRSKPLAILKRDFVQITISPVSGTRRERILSAVKSCIHDRKLSKACIVRTSGSSHLELVKESANKLQALQDLIRHWKLEPSRIIYFGDEFFPGGNDEPITQLRSIMKVAVNTKRIHEIPKTVIFEGRGPSAVARFLRRSFPTQEEYCSQG